jgi:hypothetical protein
MILPERLSRPLGLVLHPDHAARLEDVRRDAGLNMPPLAWVTIDPTIASREADPHWSGRPAWATERARAGRATWVEQRRAETEAAIRAACEQLRAAGLTTGGRRISEIIGKDRAYVNRVMRRMRERAS